jgi:hypothetical protein
MAKRTDNPYRLLVELAEFDPETARPGDWLNYQAGLTMLTVGGNVQMATHLLVEKPLKLPDPETEVRAVHADLQKVVRQFAAGGRVELVPVTAKVAAIGSEPAPTGRLLVTGSRRDTAILMAVMLLARPEQPPLALCPEDGRVFLRVRRQQYCSRACVNRANVRAYRQRLLEQAKAPTTKRRPGK